VLFERDPGTYRGHLLLTAAAEGADNAADWNGM
jgi:hypothetical protein